jgi:putative tricarboxylic transport membrane protein
LVGIGIGICRARKRKRRISFPTLVAKKQSKHPEQFGTGIIDGIVAPETRTSGHRGALIPLMTLGIPGDGVTALILGGFSLIHGIAPGPMLFRTHALLVYTIFAALIVASVAMLLLEFYGLRIFIKLLQVPKHILLPIIFVLCVVGAFGLNSRMFDVWTILLFGALGYGYAKFSIPQAPFIIGFILGPMAETNFRRGLMLSDGNFLGFVTNPISGVFLGLACVSVLWPIVQSRFGRKASNPKA